MSKALNLRDDEGRHVQKSMSRIDRRSETMVAVVGTWHATTTGSTAADTNRCPMTWRVDGHLKGLLCFHVDDPEYDRLLQVNGIHDWGALENDNMQQCGSPTKLLTLDQVAHARKVGLVGRSARHHMSECLT